MTWRIKMISPTPAQVAAPGRFAGHRGSPPASDPRYTLDHVLVDAGTAARRCLHGTPMMGFAVLQAGRTAERDGYHAVCVNSMVDDGVLALRSVLTIPVIGAGSAAMHLACLLGARFTILTPTPRWLNLYDELVDDQQLQPRLASVRHTDPHAAEPLAGTASAATAGSTASTAAAPAARGAPHGALRRGDDYLAAVERTCRSAIAADNADVIVLGATSMHDEHRHLVPRLPVPVIEPGAAAVEAAALVLSMGPLDP